MGTWLIRSTTLLCLLGSLSGCNLQALRTTDPQPVPTSTDSQNSQAPNLTASRSTPLHVLTESEVVPSDATRTSNDPDSSGSSRATERADVEEIYADLWERLRSGYALPDMEHERVVTHVKWLERNQGYLDRVAERARPYLHYIVEEVDRRGMPLELALLPVVESAYQPFAYSHGRAAGIWQFVPSTGRRFGLKQNWWYDGRRDIVAATNAALDYLASLHERFEGDWLHAIAAYNCGEGNVAKAIARNRRVGKASSFWDLKLPRETRGYVPRLLAVSRVVKNPEAHGLSLSPIANKPYVGPVDVGSQMDLALAAELAEISLEDLYRLNPGFNRWATAPTGPHSLLLPLDRHAVFRERLASLPPEKRVRWERHRIRSGETLSHIASKYRTTVRVLKEVNNIRGTRIREGHSLIVPVAAKSMREYSLTADARQQAIQARTRRGTKTTYIVRPGDSLWEIARRHRVGTRQLARWNGMAPRDTLRPGRKLFIWEQPQWRKAVVTTHGNSPAVTGETRRQIRYTVRRGESLWQISRRFNVSVASLRKWNTLRKGDYLQPGQKLIVYVDVTRQAEHARDKPKQPL